MSDNPQQLAAVVADVKKRFADAVIAIEDSFGDTVMVVDRKHIYDVLKHLREQGFDMLLDIAGVDAMKLDRPERFEITYNLYAMSTDLRLRVKISVPEDDMNVRSVSDIWQSANWAEREAYDMFGFNFEGHPNLARILNHRQFEGYPLRKDYPVMKGQWATTTADLSEDLKRE